jgi:hypothetical protein
MKQILKYKLLAALTVVVLLAACNKDTTYLANPVVNNNNAFVKIVHAAPNFSTAWGGIADAVNVFYTADNGMFTKINGTTLAYDKYYPTTTNPYFQIAPATQSLRFSVGGVLLADSINFYSTKVRVEAGNHYTYIITDSLKNGGMFLFDVMPTLDTKTYGLRLVHAITNDTAGKTIDVFSSRVQANIFSASAATTASGFISLPTSTLNDTLIIRRAGTTFELARVNGFGGVAGRSYTMIYRGNGAVAPSVTTGKPRGAIIYAN